MISQGVKALTITAIIIFILGAVFIYIWSFFDAQNNNETITQNIIRKVEIVKGGDRSIDENHGYTQDDKYKPEIIVEDEDGDTNTDTVTIEKKEATKTNKETNTQTTKSTTTINLDNTKQTNDIDTTPLFASISLFKDVNTTNASSGTVLAYNGDQWVPVPAGLNTDNQLLSINNNELSIENGNTIKLETYQYTAGKGLTLKDKEEFKIDAPTCTTTEVLTWDGSNFKCITSTSGVAYTPGDAITLNNNEIAVVSPTCTGTDKLQWSGSSFICSPDENTTTFTGLTDTPASYTANQLVRVNNTGTGLEYYSDAPYYDNTDNQNLTSASLTGNTLTITIEDGNPVNVDLTNLINDADYDITNEIQDLSLTGNNLTITNNIGSTTINLTPYLDNTDTQAISRTGDTISITGNTSTVDLTPYINTDSQTLALSTNTLSISNGNQVSLLPYLDNTDTQTLSFSNPNISITGGNSIDISGIDTNTTYTASGTLLDLTGTTFSLDEGTLTNNQLCAYVSGTGLVCTTDPTNWNTAYGWGDHAAQGYLTDAPTDGNTYGRNNGVWATISSGGTPAGATGALQFNNAGAFGADTPNLFWDDANNRLGVGTNAPGHALTIEKSDVAGGGLGPAINLKNKNPNDPSGSGFNIAWSNYQAGNGAILAQFGANYGTGTSLPWSQGSGFYVTTRTDHPIIFGTGTSWAEHMRISNAGNVGIGTTSPDAKLDVNGGVIIRDGGGLVLSDAGGSFAPQNNTLRIVHPSYLEYTDLRYEDDENFYWNTASAADRNFHIINTGSGDANLIIDDGNVGVGTVTPSAKLEVVGNVYASNYVLPDDGYLYWRTGDGSTKIQGRSDGSEYISLSTNSVERVYIDNVGNVGVGNIIPAYKLDVTGAGRFTQPLTVGTYTLPNTDGSNGQVLQTNGGGALTWTTPSGGGADNDWTVNGNDMYSAVSGSVGIGTSSPGFSLQVGSGATSDITLTNGIFLADSTAAYISTKAGSGAEVFFGSDTLNAYGIFGTLSNHDLGIRTNNIVRMTIGNDGNVDFTNSIGVGTAATDVGLTIANNVATGALDTYDEYQIMLYDQGVASNSYGLGIRSSTMVFNSGSDFNFDQAGSTVMTISDGDVGIGNTSPSYKLDVTGNGRFTQALTIGAYTLPIADGTSAQVLQTDGSGNVGWGTVAAGVDGDWTVNGNDIYSAVTGNVGIGVTSPGAKLAVNGELLVGTNYPDVNSIAVFRRNVSFEGIAVKAPDGPRIYFDEGVEGSESSRAFIGLQETDNAFVMRNWGGVGNQVLFSVQSGGSRTNYIGTTEVMTLLHDGNAGFGTTSPTQRLHVDGSARITGGYYDSNNEAGTMGQILSATATGTDWITNSGADTLASLSCAIDEVAKWNGSIWVCAADNDINDLDWIASGSDLYSGVVGNVGIGTSTPSNIFDVYDNVTGEYVAHIFNDQNSAGHGLLVETDGSGSGTSAFAVRTDIAGTPRDAFFVKGDGFVGINKSNPLSALDIAGDVTVNENSIFFTDPENANATIELAASDAVYPETGLTLRTLTNPGTGDAIFRVMSSGGSERLRVEQDGAVKTVNHLEVDGTGDSYMMGRVGVGTSSPVYALDIVGNGTGKGIRFDDGHAFITVHDGFGNFNLLSGLDDNNQIVDVAGGARLTMSSAGQTTIGSYTGTVGDTGALAGHLVVDSTQAYFDNVTTFGIGTASPEELLDISGGDILIDNAYGIMLEGIGGGNNRTLWNDITNIVRLQNQNQELRLGESGNDVVTITAGDVGIGTTLPSQKLHVSGNMRVTGAYYDSNNEVGTAGQMLSSTVTGTDWIDVPNSNTDTLANLTCSTGQVAKWNGSAWICAVDNAVAGAADGDWVISSNNLDIGVTGAVRNNSGSASVPAYTFIGDTNTGMYRTGSDSIGFTTGNVNKMTINNSGVTIPNLVVSGNFTLSSVPIKTINGSSSAPSHTFTSDTNTGMYRAGSDSLGFTAGNVNRMTVNASGVNVYALSTGRTVTATGIITGSAMRAGNGSSSSPSHTFSGDYNTGMYSAGSDAIGFTAGNVNRMTVNASGVNVYALSTGRTVTATGIITGSAMRTGGGSSSVPSHSFSGDTNTGMYSAGGDAIGFTTGNSNRMTINSSGVSVSALSSSGAISANGIMTTGSSIRTTNGSSSAPSHTFSGDYNTGMYRVSEDVLGFTTGNSNRMTINSSGVSVSALSSSSNISASNVIAGAYLRSGGGSPGAPSHSFSGDTNTGMYLVGNDIIGFTTGNSNRMVIHSSGRIGIGDTSPAYKLEIGGGDINMTGGGYRDAGSCVAGTCASDVRLKENIQPIEGSLEKLLQLNPSTFSFIDEKYGSLGVNYGFIAQELEQIYPDWVTEDENDGYKRVKYGLNMQMATINAIKEQNIQLTSNTLQTDTNITNLTQLQTSVDENLATIQGQFVDVGDTHTGLSLRMDNMENNLLEKLREDIDLIDKTQNILLATVSTNTDTIIAINENILFTTDEGNKNIVTISGITMIDELKVNRIAINDTLTEEKNGEDVNAASVGTVEIPAGEIEVTVETTAIDEGGRVFVTPVSEMGSNTFHVEKDFDNQNFTIIIDHSLDNITEFDWFLIN